jgi:S1-C subfamily serine protease
MENGPSYDCFSIREGTTIANANGIPGTLGCLALSREDKQFVFLTSHHVLFGAGAREQDAVWVATHDNRRTLQRAARARHGRCSIVRHDGTDIFVDCATVEFDRWLMPQECRAVPEDGKSELVPGDRVTKVGAVTGRTEGVVIDTNYSNTVRVGGRRCITPGQILIRPVVTGDIFTTDGDSGAVLRNADGAVVGLLWGIDARGYGLACPISPVLWILHLQLVQLAQKEIS